MVGKPQHRDLGSADRFKRYKGLIDLLKYSPATLKKRVSAIAKKSNSIYDAWCDKKLSYDVYSQRCGALKSEYNDTVSAYLFKKNFKKTMKRFPIKLGNIKKHKR
jgi:hypothetical protein